MADYLETIGWYNVDGDWVFMSKKPEDQKLKGDLMAALKKIIHNEAVTEAEKSVHKGYYKGLCDKAIASANQGTNTAISFVLYTRWLSWTNNLLLRLLLVVSFSSFLFGFLPRPFPHSLVSR